MSSPEQPVAWQEINPVLLQPNACSQRESWGMKGKAWYFYQIKLLKQVLKISNCFVKSGGTVIGDINHTVLPHQN